MTKQVWLNLSSKDLDRARKFFTAIGFRVNENHSNETMLGIFAGEKNFPVMLFEEKTFAEVIMHTVTDTAGSSEVIISFDAESREEVDEMCKKATDAGGNVFSKPAEIQGWMYGCAFTDPDGHRWNILYMDMAKRQKQNADQ